MYNKKKILAFIPARKGSKRIPFKNEKMLNGKPLFQYSVEIAKKSKYIDDILVSSDSQAILDKAHKFGCLNNKLRPKILSGDNARIVDAMLYEISLLKSKYDAIVLLQPTSPYRTIHLLDKAIEKYFESETSLITVVKCKENPLFIRKIENGKLKKIILDSSDIRSQDLDDFYRIVGCIYINNINLLSKNTILNENEVPFIIDDEFDIDIDTKEEFYNAEKKMAGMNL